MIPIIPEFVHEFAALPHLRLNPRQRQHLEQYLISLMICGDHMITAPDDPELERQASGGVELLLEEYPWDDKMLEDERGRLIQEIARKNGIESGVLIMEPLAEPVLLPEGESAGGEKQSLALSHFSCEAFHVPLDFETFRGMGKTPKEDGEEKNSALQTLFAKGLKRDLPLSMVWMDAWFFCPEAVDFLEKKHHFPFIAAVDKNFQVVIRDQTQTLFECAASLPLEAYKLQEVVTGPKSRSVYRYLTLLVDLASVGRIRLVIAYELMGQKEPIFLATNQLDWGIERILWKYNHPQFVEQLWRNSLNPFGIGRGGIEWQVRMSFLAETLFQLNAAPLLQPERPSPHENKSGLPKTAGRSAPRFQNSPGI